MDQFKPILMVPKGEYAGQVLLAFKPVLIKSGPALEIVLTVPYNTYLKDKDHLNGLSAYLSGALHDLIVVPDKSMIMRTLEALDNYMKSKMDFETELDTPAEPC